MYNFFDFYTNIPKQFAFKNFDFEHIASIIIIFSFICFVLHILKKLSSKMQSNIIKACAIFVPIVEISHNIWLALYSNASIVNLLSLHLCGLQMYFIPLAVFTKFFVFKDFVFATSILGGIFGIVFPSGVTGFYPLWHFQTLQTFLYHGLLIFVPLALLLCTNYKPSLKRFHKVLGLFLLIAILAFVIDYSFDQNYLFLRTSPDMPLLRNIQLNYGTAPYLIFTFFALLIICICIHLPFHFCSKCKEKTHTV